MKLKLRTGGRIFSEIKAALTAISSQFSQKYIEESQRRYTFPISEMKKESSLPIHGQ